MEWVRGETLGRGSFASVNLAIPRNSFSTLPPLMAVKSCADASSVTLKNEKQIFDQLGLCPQIVRCLGDDHSFENGELLYNLFLEYASKGSLADLVKKNVNGCLKEFDVKRYARSLLEGLDHIHSQGFVHCDLKLQNVLVFENDAVKIADFGLAKKSGKTRCREKQSEEGDSRIEYRGTPLYMSPESVNDNDYESPADIWALGCAVVEMVTGKPAWNHSKNSNVFSLLVRIGVGDELPIIPTELSEEGKDFLMKCFVKDPKRRWTAGKLLNHPFVAVDDRVGRGGNGVVSSKASEFIPSVSPRSPFSFPEWQSSARGCVSFEFDSSSSLSSRECCLDRIKKLAADEIPNWSVSGNWINVR